MYYFKVNGYKNLSTPEMLCIYHKVCMIQKSSSSGHFSNNNNNKKKNSKNKQSSGNLNILQWVLKEKNKLQLKSF